MSYIDTTMAEVALTGDRGAAFAADYTARLARSTEQGLRATLPLTAEMNAGAARVVCDAEAASDAAEAFGRSLQQLIAECTQFLAAVREADV